MTTEWVRDLSVHVGELVASMRHDAIALEDIGEIVEAAIDGVSPRYDYDTARATANRINAVVVHAMILLANLQRSAGRLEGMAQCAEIAGGDDGETKPREP